MVAAAGVGALPVADLAGKSRKRISGGHRDDTVDVLTNKILPVLAT